MMQILKKIALLRTPEIFIHRNPSNTFWIALGEVESVETVCGVDIDLEPVRFAGEVMPFQYVSVDYSEESGLWVIDPNVQMGCQVRIDETLDSSVNKRMMKLRKKISDLNDQVTKLQAECPHARVKETYRSDTGNYSRSDDKYWINFECLNCGKRWSEDQ